MVSSTPYDHYFPKLSLVQKLLRAGDYGIYFKHCEYVTFFSQHVSTTVIIMCDAIQIKNYFLDARSIQNAKK